MVKYLERLGSDQKYYLEDEKDTFLIGRNEACDIKFTSLYISRQHCQVQRLLPSGTLTIKNLKQTNITYVDNIELRDTSKCAELHVGSRIGLGVPLSYADEEGFQNKDYVFLSLCSTDNVADTKSINLDETLQLSPRLHDASPEPHSLTPGGPCLPSNYPGGTSCSAQQLGATLGQSSVGTRTPLCPQSDNSLSLQHHQNPLYFKLPDLVQDNHPQSHASAVSNQSVSYVSANSHLPKSSALIEPPCATSSPPHSRPCTWVNPHHSTFNPLKDVNHPRSHVKTESQDVGGPYGPFDYPKPHNSANIHNLMDSSDSANLSNTARHHGATHSTCLNKLDSRNLYSPCSHQTSDSTSSQSSSLLSENSTSYQKISSSQPAQPLSAQYLCPGDNSKMMQINISSQNLVHAKPISHSTAYVENDHPVSHISSRHIFDVQLPSEKKFISQRDHNENARPLVMVAPLQSDSKQLWPISDVSCHPSNRVMESNNCSQEQHPQMSPEIDYITSSRGLRKESSSQPNNFPSDTSEKRCQNQAQYASSITKSALVNHCLLARSNSPRLDAVSRNESTSIITTNKHQDAESKISGCSGVVASVAPIVKNVKDCKPSNELVICDTSNSSSDHTDCDEIIDLTQNDPDSPEGSECDNQLEKCGFVDLSESPSKSKDAAKRKRDDNNKTGPELLKNEEEDRPSTIASLDSELPDLESVEEGELLSGIESLEEDELLLDVHNRKRKRINRIDSDSDCNDAGKDTDLNEEMSLDKGSEVDTVIRKDSITASFGNSKCNHECSVHIAKLPSYLVEDIEKGKNLNYKFPPLHSEHNKCSTSCSLEEKSGDTGDSNKTLSSESCTDGFKLGRSDKQGGHKRKRSENGTDRDKDTKNEKKLKSSDRSGSVNELDRDQTSQDKREEIESKSGIIVERDVCIMVENGARIKRENSTSCEITYREEEKKNIVDSEEMIVKKERSECDQSKLINLDCTEDDDIDFINYSQVDDAIWVSSDEEESNNSNSSLSNPNLEELFREVKTENVNEDSFDSRESTPVVKTEPVDDQWFPILSQSCWDDDDIQIIEDETPSTSSSPSSVPKAGPHVSSPSSEDEKDEDDGNCLEWWPQLSQGFFDEDEKEEGSNESCDSSNSLKLKQKNRLKTHPVSERKSYKEINQKERDSKSHKLSERYVPKKKTANNSIEGHTGSGKDDLDGSKDPLPDLHLDLPDVSDSSCPGPSHHHDSNPTFDNDNAGDDQDDWWPQLSQGFFDDCVEEEKANEIRNRCKDGDQVNKDFQEASGNSGNLDTVVSKLKRTHQRRSMLTSPKKPPPRTKSDTLKKRGSACPEFYGKPAGMIASRPVDKENRRDSQESSSEETRNVRKVKNVSPREVSKKKKKDKRQQSLRDNLASKFNLEPYKATLEHKPKEKHHLVPKTKSDSSNQSQIQPHSSASRSLNISFQNKNKSKVPERQEKARPKVAAKVTKKTRSEKLTDIDIFKDMPSSHSKSKRSNFKIPKMTAKTKGSLGEPSSSCLEEGGSSIPVLAKTHKELSNSLNNSQSQKLQTEPSIAEEKQEEGKVLPKPVIDKYQRSLDGSVSTRGILKSFTANTNRPPKKVLFPADEDLVSIRTISPRKKKECLGIPEVRAREMGICQVRAREKNSLMLHNDCSPVYYLDSFIHHICTWNFEWLQQYHDKLEKTETQGRGQIAHPPPVGSSANYPTLIMYDSYADYKEIFSNLIYLEVWEAVYKDWLKFRDSNLDLPALTDAMQPAFISTASHTLKFWTLKLYTLITETQDAKGYHPRQGSLISLKIQEGNRKYRMFGYVDYLVKNKRYAVTSELKAACPYGTVCLLLGIRVTKEPITRVRPGRIVSINHVTYLRPSTRIWEGLCLLPRSPLCKLILQPNIQAFQKCSNEDSHYLVEEMPINDVQQKAVVEVSSKCLFDPYIPKLSLIHGPPGTGKTRTITALIAQMITHGQQLQSEGRGRNCRVLLCAPSNAAADELTLRLAQLREVNICLRVVRVGVRGSIRSDVQSYTLDAFVQKQMRMELTTPRNMSMRQEWERRKVMVEKAAENLQNARRENKSKAEVQQMEMRLCELVRSKGDLEKSFQTQLSAHDRQIMQQKWQNKVLLGAEVVTTTLGSCMSGVMEDMFNRHPNHFTCCIVDEAGQCQETETWLPLLLGVRKLVLVGDHRQLPATVLSRLAQDKNLKQSLFERLYHRVVVELQEEDLVHALTTQYRMHPEIAKWPSEHFYQDRLTTSQTIVQARSYALKPYLVFDLKNSQEQRHQGRELYNPTEAALIYNICEALQGRGCQEKIAVITPYMRQKLCLDSRLSKFHGSLDLVVSTVDAFQGQERDIVILSFVRGNKSSQIGFLAQRQRLNVALTRARKSCFVVANLSSLSDNMDYKALVRDAIRRKVVCVITEREENDRSYLKFLFR